MFSRLTLLLSFFIALFIAPLLSHAQTPGVQAPDAESSNKKTTSEPAQPSSSGCPFFTTDAKIGLSVHIPGITKKDPKIKNCYFLEGDLVDYIKGLYTFGLTVGGFLAVVMIMIGGVIWAGAGGNPELVKKGQERVLNAIFGLVLLLTSYTILNLINPDLVKLTRINPDPTSTNDLTLKDLTLEEARAMAGRLSSQQINDFVANVMKKKGISDPIEGRRAAMIDAAKEMNKLFVNAEFNYHGTGDPEVARKNAARIFAESQIVTDLYKEAVEDIATTEENFAKAKAAFFAIPEADLKAGQADYTSDVAKKNMALNDAMEKARVEKEAAVKRVEDASKIRKSTIATLAKAEQFASCLGAYQNIPQDKLPFYIRYTPGGQIIEQGSPWVASGYSKITDFLGIVPDGCPSR